MKLIELAYRITKIGGRAVSVAVCAITGMVLMGSAMADSTTTLASGGSATPGVIEQGYAFISSGYYSANFWSTVDINVQTPVIDALAIGTYYNPDGFGTYANTIINDNLINIFSGKNINGRSLANGALAAIYTDNSYQDNNTGGDYTRNNNYSYFGRNTTLNLAGNNQINGIVGYNFTTWDNTGRADMLGTINLNGSNVAFGSDVYAGTTNINSGTNNTNSNDYTFYGALYSNLTFNQAASVLLNGGLHAAAENLGGTNQSTQGNLNFNGYNSIVTLGANQTIDGTVTTSGVNGVLVFQGAGNVSGTVGSSSSTLKEVRTNGTGNVLFAQQAYVDYVNYQAASLVGFNGGLNLTVDQSSQAKNQVAFNNNDGVLQINNGDLTGKAGSAVVSTTGNNLGTVTMVSGTQSITGGIGANGHAIKTLNIGGNNSGGLDTSTANYSATTANGDIYAQNIVLNNDSVGSHSSTLTMASGYNLTGTVSTENNGLGILTLAGGTQLMTGTVGTTGARLSQVNSGATPVGATPTNSTFTGNVFAASVNNTGTGSSTFNANVTATNAINVNTGTTLISGTAMVDGSGGQINVTSGSLTVTGATNLTGTGASINVGSGVATFNGATTIGTGNVNFTANAGTVNFNQNAAFTNLNYAGKTGTVNVASGKNITATAITTATINNTGTLNMLGGAQTVGATVGANGLALNLITAGADSATTNFTNTAAVYASTLQVTGNGAVNLSGGLAGNLSYTNNVANENGTVTVAAGKNVMGTVTTGSNSSNQAGSQGILTMAGGTQQVSGAIGSATAALKTINAGADSATTNLNGMVYADTVLFSGNGTVALNGTNAGNAIGGLVGTADLNNGSGTLSIGDGVKLTTGATGIQFANANAATLTFAGSSTVTGVVGGNTAGNSTFQTINAGATASTVTFLNDVYVSDVVLTTLDITGTGTVNLRGNLTGAVQYLADGTVNVSDGKSITTTQARAATTNTTNTGTLNFLGATTLSADLGVSGTNLKAVNFNTASNNVTQAINKNVFANTVTIGGSAGTTAVSKADVTGVYDYAGATSMTAFVGGTTANISNVGSTTAIALGGDLVIANATTAVNFGVAHVATGSVTTNGGALSFTVNTTDITSGGSVSASAGSGQVTATGALTMTGAEKVQVNYVGSLAQGGTYALIASASGTDKNLGGETGSQVSDNSFSIDTSVAQSSNGSLILTADRTGGTTYAANQNYIQKANTVGDFSNNAGIVLGGIAAAGTQTGDMVEVIQKLELDSFGYGNTAAKLATQVKRLAPVANASVTQSSLAAAGLSLNAVDVRMAALRGDTTVASSDAVTGLSAGDAVASNGFWLKALGSSNAQDKQGAYDGYTSKVYGLAAGVDNRIDSDLVLGIALGLTKADVNQADFRAGDTNRVDNTQLMAYGTYKLTPEWYLDGALSYARNAYTGVRATAVGRTASSAFNGNQMGARLGLGYGIDLGSNMKLTPMASVDYARLNQDAYTETGAGAINLAVDAQSTSNTRVGLGARLSDEWTDGGTTYRPEVALNWSQNSNTNINDVTASFVGGGAAFVTPGTTSISRNSVNLGLAMTVLSSKTSSIQIRYDLDTSTGFKANTGSLLARWEY